MSPKTVRAAGAVLCLALVGSGPAHAIVGGSEEPSSLAASTAMILSSRGGVCSGIVLAPTVLITAGHCVAGGVDVRVHWREAGEPVLVEPASVVVHPGYDAAAIAKRRRSTDLALVALKQPLPPRFVPASLSAAPAVAGSTITIGGYGVLREREARTTGTFRIAQLAVVEPYGPSRVLLWFDDPDRRGRGPCTGDSGGPAAAPDGTVLGVVAWASGAGGRACGGRSQAVLVGPERGWIDRTLGGWSARATWR